MTYNDKRTILLVEDNVITAMDEQLSLEKYGYNIIPAYSGQEAIDIFNNNGGIELILMDIDLGTGINGPDAARAILKIRETPIVFLSSHNEPEIVETTEKITSYGYVVKNSGITVLDASIKMAFRLFDAKRQIASTERKQQAMLSNIRDIIGITDSNGFVKYVSPNITRRFGWEPEDIIGTNSMSRIHTDDLEKSKTGYCGLISQSNNTGVMVFRYRCKDESYRNIEVTATNLVNDPLINGILFNYHDITDKLETENALKVSEANYRQLYENAPAGIYRVDFKTGKFIRANDVFLGYLGYTREEITLISPFDLLTDNSKRLFGERLQKISRGETVSNTVDYEVLDKSGNMHYVHLLNKMVYDDKGQITASDVVAYEITDRIRMENALKKSEADFRSMLGNVPGMVYRCANDKDWTMKFISDGVFRLTGFYPHELLNNSGRAYADLIYPDDRSYVWGKLQDAIKCSGHWELEYRIVARDKNVKWVYERGQVVEGEPDYEKLLEGYITDITRYKVAEGEISKREEKYRRIFENIQDCYYEVTLNDNTIAEISPSIEFVSNGQYRREELIGKHMSFFYSDMMDRDSFLKQISERGSVTDYEIPLKNRDGSIMPCSFSSKLIYDENGCPERIIGIMRNITERKRFDENVAKLLKEKELLLKEVHHRIKNNMNTIYGLLALQAESASEPAAVSAIKDAASRVNSMMILYDKLYRSHDVTALPVNIYIPSLVDEIVMNFPNSKMVKIEKYMDEFVLDVKIIQPLGIIINELMTNIMKYAFTGMEQGIITISISKDSGIVTVMIKDNGKGIPESVDFNNSRGFGLMLVQLLAKQLKGDVRIERQNGTAVILEFSV
ncbi:MAG TPA: PAS domain S-box protein [Spirochaetota bacterium]|nr:PAS domain S-box protein [Spirochaetota bacterium]